ncbi:MAG: hypothetical protein FD130_2180, partial [Halothiobacillaceae bacterium]
PRLPVKIGVVGMSDGIAESGSFAKGAVAEFGTTLVNRTVYGVDLHYDNGHFDALGEFYLFKNEDKVGSVGSHEANAYYLQVGYQVTENFKPVYRYESVDFAAADTYFQYLGTHEGTRHVVGLRYDLDASNALKIEANRRQPTSATAPNASDETSYTVQWAFLMW